MNIKQLTNVSFRLKILRKWYLPKILKSIDFEKFDIISTKYKENGTFYPEKIRRFFIDTGADLSKKYIYSKSLDAFSG